MGFTPREIDDMTLWEFRACIDGFNSAHGGDDKPEPPSDDEFDAMLRARRRKSGQLAK